MGPRGTGREEVAQSSVTGAATPPCRPIRDATPPRWPMRSRAVSRAFGAGCCAPPQDLGGCPAPVTLAMLPTDYDGPRVWPNIDDTCGRWLRHSWLTLSRNMNCILCITYSHLSGRYLFRVSHPLQPRDRSYRYRIGSYTEPIGDWGLGSIIFRMNVHGVFF